MPAPSLRLIAGVAPPAQTVAFTFEGRRIDGFAGEALASAIMRSGVLALRRSRIGDEPRGYFCGMGLCWECAVHVEGLGVVKSCSHPVADGMIVSFADGRPGR
jgi:sarcosine oxidase subunit alpha